MEITKITKKEAHNIISVFDPLGLFYLESNGRFVAIDNSSGEAFIEEFNDEEGCLQWLKDCLKHGN